MKLANHQDHTIKATLNAFFFTHACSQDLKFTKALSLSFLWLLTRRNLRRTSKVFGLRVIWVRSIAKYWVKSYLGKKYWKLRRGYNVRSFSCLGHTNPPHHLWCCKYLVTLRFILKSISCIAHFTRQTKNT